MPQNTAEISFAEAFVDNATKADPSITGANINAFDVWAFMQEVGGTVFTDENVTKSNGVWGYKNIQYWYPERTYYFAALAPMDSANVTETLASGEAAKLGLGTVSFTNVNGTEDLLYAKKSVTTPNAATLANQGMEPVKMQFQHLLSKVKFTFQNGFNANNTTVEVTGVTMSAPKSGTIDLAQANYATEWQLGTENITLAFGDVANPLALTDAAAAADERLTIPADATKEYAVSFHVAVYQGEVLAMESDINATISGIALEMGKAYNFTAVINQDVLDLKPIQFTASVDEWDEGGNGNAANGTAIHNVDELKAALAAGGSYALVNDLTVDADETLKVAAGKNVILDLYGHTITAESDQNSGNRDVFDVRGSLTIISTSNALTRSTNGGIVYEHKGTDMGWSASTNIFNVTAGGDLHLHGITAENKGGSAMAFVAHLNNWGKCTLSVDDCVLKSTYITVRVFNSGYDMNNVTIKNTTLKGKYCFWVHNYKLAGDSAGTDATLNLNIYNGGEQNSNNVFDYSSKAPVLFGFNNPIYYDENGNVMTFLTAIPTVSTEDAEDAVYEGIGVDSEGAYVVTEAAGMLALSELIAADKDDNNNCKGFAGKTVKLDADVDLSEDNWDPIGDNSTDVAFAGVFDGQGHTIKGAHITGDHCFNGSVYGNKEGWGLFAVVDGATVKNLKVDGATFGSYTVISGVIAGYANNTTFENIDITNSKVAGYNWYTGGVVGWAQGECTFKDVNLDETVAVGTLWDSHGQSAGGIAGGVSASSKIIIEDCNIACVMDVINDVTSNYKWCVYRVAGMLIGNTNTTETKYNEVVTATATNVTCKNVTVTYGKWMNYHYCEGFWNRGWGRYESSDYVGGVDQDEPHNHSDGEKHCECFPFDQLFGGSSNGSGHYPVKGLAEFPGVTVNYPAKYTCPTCGQQHGK